jgi:hypothetical protein
VVGQDTISSSWARAIQDWNIPPEDDAHVVSVEPADVDGAPGIVIVWTQAGVHRYGLSVTIAEVLAEYGPDAFTQGLSDLQIAVVEPHPRSEGSRMTWFRQLP